MNNSQLGTKMTWISIRLILICTFSVILLSSCSPNSRYGVEDIQYIPFSDNLAVSEDISYQWKSDAYLVSVISMISMKTDSSPLIINYTFRSPSDPGIWLSVSITKEGDNIDTDTSEGTFSEGDSRPLPLEINLKSQAVSSHDAISIAMKNGGLDFINRHNGINNRSYLKYSQHNTAFATGKNEIVVGFSTDDLEVIYVTINPTNGNVEEIFRNDE